MELRRRRKSLEAEMTKLRNLDLEDQLRSVVEQLKKKEIELEAARAEWNGR